MDTEEFKRKICLLPLPSTFLPHLPHDLDTLTIKYIKKCCGVVFRICSRFKIFTLTFKSLPPPLCVGEKKTSNYNGEKDSSNYNVSCETHSSFEKYL